MSITSTAVTSAVACVVLAVGGALAGTSRAVASPPQEAASGDRRTGERLYRTHCAVCHGAAGRGDGPMAPDLRRPPPDLTTLARANGGVFPAALMTRVIDGREGVRGHGGPDMPVWGDVFRLTPDADEASIRARIAALVTYLDALQSRDGH